MLNEAGIGNGVGFGDGYDGFGDGEGDFGVRRFTGDVNGGVEDHTGYFEVDNDLVMTHIGGFSAPSS